MERDLCSCLNTAEGDLLAIDTIQNLLLCPPACHTTDRAIASLM